MHHLPIFAIMQTIIEAVDAKLLKRNYAHNTRTTYLSFIKRYLTFCNERSLKPEKGYDAFIMNILHAGHSVSTQNQAINAIKFYLEKIKGMDRIYISIDRPMKPRRLPQVLSLEEVDCLLATPKNLKHKAMLHLIYGCGLRCGELLSLKISAIDGHRKMLHIKQSKGRKDRMVPIPDVLLKLLRDYYRQFKPCTYLFEGQLKKEETGHKPYSASSLQKIFKRACKKAGIRKYVTLHTLRHSYATHMYEHGIELRSIQVLLGHNSSRTTEIYTHVANKHLATLPSPLDFLGKKS